MDLNSLPQLQAAIKGCNKCHLRELGGKPVPGYGPRHAILFVVGEAPNRQAEAQNMPFVGWTGRVLTCWLEYLGLKRDKVYITDTVKCALRDNEGHFQTDGYGPSGEQWICRDWLVEELRLIKPEVVLLIGWVATESVLRMPIYKVQEHKTGYEAEGRRYFAAGHPGRRTELLDEHTKVTLERLRPFLTV